MRSRRFPAAAFALASSTFLCAGIVPRVAFAQVLTQRPVDRERLPAGEQLVDAVVAVVELQSDERAPVFVLQSDVVLAARIELAARGGSPALAVPIDEDTFRAATEQVIGERLLEREAARARDAPPTMQMVGDESRRLDRRLAAAGGIAALLTATGSAADDLHLLVRRRVIVSGYLEGHLARSVEPSEADVRAAYDSERVGPYRAEGTPFAEVRAVIRVALIRDSFARAIRSYLQSISSRATIRSFVPERTVTL